MHRATADPNLKTGLIAGLLALAAITIAALALSASSAEAGGSISTGGGGIDPAATARDQRYARIWKRTPARQKRWAHRTARCESNRDPRAIGGGGLYRGAFQFRKDTWRRAPKSPGGDPIRFSYKTQAVVAVALKRKDGAHHWPNCG